MVTTPTWAQAPWAGVVLPAPNVGQLPPPIPGTTATFSYNAQLGAYPWGYASWAGGSPLPTYPGGGVITTPQPDLGVMQVTVWWPYTSALQLVRITPDGARTPVRGGFPLAAGARATRRNLCPNPSVEAGLNGYLPDAGNPALTQLPDPSAPAGALVLRATIAAAGSNGVTVPTALTTPGWGQMVTVGWSMRLSTWPTSMTLSIGWTTAAGATLPPNTVTLNADQLSTSIAQWGRHVAAVLPPDGAATPTVKIIAAGLPAGATMDLDAITIEIGTTDGSPIDGRMVGGAWTGTPDLSVSVLAPVYTLADGECPLDVPVVYQVAAPGIPGGRVLADPVTLASNDQSWLTHPASPGVPVRCRPTAAPALTRAAVQASFTVLGRDRPVVVSTPRLSPTGTLTLDTATFIERDHLLGLFADGSPLLLRAPGDYGLGAGWWLALGDLSEDPGGRPQWSPGRALAAPFTVVDPPPVS